MSEIDVVRQALEHTDAAYTLTRDCGLDVSDDLLRCRRMLMARLNIIESKILGKTPNWNQYVIETYGDDDDEDEE